MATVFVRTLGALEERGASHCIDVVTKDLVVRQLYTSVKSHLKFLVREKYLKATHATLTCSASNQDIIRLTEKSKIYRGEVFDFNCEALEVFLNAPVVAVRDALSKDPYERFSVTGTVVKVSPLKESSRSKRRELELEDVNDRSKKVCVNLWRQTTDSEAIEVDTTVVVKNIYSKMYNNSLNLNSTQQTTVEVVDCDQRATLKIDGFNVDENGMLHLDTADNVEYKVEEGLILDRLELDCLDDLQAAMPFCIDVMYRSVDRSINKFNTE